jgi:Ecdysteroid kinase-like family
VIPTWDTLTAAWLAECLGLSGTLSLQVSPVGTGQVADSRRLALWEGDHLVTSVVAKGPSMNPESRATATTQRLYLREVAFYQELAPHVDVRTPACFYAAIDTDDSFLLLFEDLAPSAPIDQFTGLSVPQAAEGLRALAALHVPTTRRDDLFARDWLGGTRAMLAPLYQAVLPGLFDAFLTRYADADPEVLTMVRRFAERLPLFTGQHTPDPCVVHGDFRTDNLLFDARDGAIPLAVVDWQTVAVGSPFLDVAYFLATSLTPEVLMRESATLLEAYRDERARRGAPIDAAEAQSAFARYMLQPLAMLVPASVIVERTPRGDTMFLEMLRRATTVCEHFDSIHELERHAAA